VSKQFKKYGLIDTLINNIASSFRLISALVAMGHESDSKLNKYNKVKLLNALLGRL